MKKFFLLGLIIFSLNLYSCNYMVRNPESNKMETKNNFNKEFNDLKQRFEVVNVEKVKGLIVGKYEKGVGCHYLEIKYGNTSTSYKTSEIFYQVQIGDNIDAYLWTLKDKENGKEIKTLTLENNLSYSDLYKLKEDGNNEK